MINNRHGRAAPSMRASLLSRHRARQRSRGQTLVEFSLVFPLFIAILFGVIEFAFIFNALLSVGFASHEAALAAAEGGSLSSADCSVLKAVQHSFDAPTDRTAISEIQIYQADKNGAKKGPIQVYDRTGTTACDNPDGSTTTLPWKATTATYPPEIRCNVLEGCGGASVGVDTIGVQVTYLYKGHTPMAWLLPGSGSGYTMIKSSAMRMEPIL